MHSRKCVTVCEQPVSARFVTNIRTVAHAGLALANACNDAWPETVRSVVHESIKVVRTYGNPSDHVADAREGAYLSAFSSQFLARRRPRNLTRYVVIADAIRSQRLLAETFCMLSFEDRCLFRQAAGVNRETKMSLHGAAAVAELARYLTAQPDVVVWYPTTSEDAVGIDLIAFNCRTMQQACIQVKASYDTCVLTNLDEARHRGGWMLMKRCETWIDRIRPAVECERHVDWHPFFVYLGLTPQGAIDDLSRLKKIVSTLATRP